jgi:phage terminase small subunit
MTQKKARFIAEFLKCGDAQAAAVAAGYSGAGGSARTLGWRLLHKDPLVKKAVADARAELRERAMVTTEGMLKQLSEDREFAISKGNPMAAVKATEIQAKLAGLLIDRVDQRTVGTLKVEVVRFSDG